MTTILANRLHHTAYVTKDLEATRAFYEDILGFPLMATYCEKDELFGKERTYCHVFFELADGSALAFFQFADPDDQAEFGPEMPSSPFIHIALQVDADGQADMHQYVITFPRIGHHTQVHLFDDASETHFSASQDLVNDRFDGDDPPRNR